MAAALLSLGAVGQQVTPPAAAADAFKLTSVSLSSVVMPALEMTLAELLGQLGLRTADAFSSTVGVTELAGMMAGAVRKPDAVGDFEELLADQAGGGGARRGVGVRLSAAPC